jgi:hypothetical protein
MALKKHHRITQISAKIAQAFLVFLCWPGAPVFAAAFDGSLSDNMDKNATRFISQLTVFGQNVAEGLNGAAGGIAADFATGADRAANSICRGAAVAAGSFNDLIGTLGVAAAAAGSEIDRNFHKAEFISKQAAAAGYRQAETSVKMGQGFLATSARTGQASLASFFEGMENSVRGTVLGWLGITETRKEQTTTSGEPRETGGEQTSAKPADVAEGQEPEVQLSQVETDRIAVESQIVQAIQPVKEIQTIRTVTNNTVAVIVDESTKAKVEQLLRQMDSDRPNFSVGQSFAMPAAVGGTSINVAGGAFAVDSNGDVSAHNITAQDDLAVQGNFIVSGTQTFTGISAFNSTSTFAANLGIGTTSPLEALDVNGRLRLAQTAAPVVTADKLYNESGNLFWNGINLTGGGSLPSGGVSGQTLRHNGAGWTAASNLFNDGANVGIGTASPGTRFDVVGAGITSATAVMNIMNASSTSALYVRNDGNVGIGTTVPASKLHVVGADTSTSTVAQIGGLTGTGFVVLNNGQVGIGTTAPLAGFGLSVIGGISATGNFYGGGVIVSGGSITSGNGFSTATSDLLVSAGSVASSTAGIIFRTNNGGTIGEVARISSAGNVGIGTTAPAFPLDVVGSIRAQSGSVYAGGINMSNAAGTGLFTNSTDLVISSGVSASSTTGIIFRTNNGGSIGEVARISSSGNVGIGTTGPQGLLHVRGSNSFANPMATIESTDGGAILEMIHPSANNPWQVVAGFAEANDFAIAADDDGTDVRMYINSSGNVGIGTTVPISKLSVAGDVKIFGGTYTGIGLGEAESTPLANYGAYIIRMNSAGTAYGDVMHFGGYGGFAWHTADVPGAIGAAKMVMDISGNVGIGTTGPVAKLEVLGGNIAIRNSNNTGAIPSSNGFLKFYGDNQAGDVNYWAGIESYRNNYSNDNDLRFYTEFGETPSERMRISSSGNVGIGTTGPQDMLHIYKNGDAYLRTEANNGTGSYRIFQIGTGSDYNFHIKDATPGQTRDIMTALYNTGNVGIGTTNPNKNLEVSQATDGAVIRISSTKNDASHSIGGVQGSLEFYSADASVGGSSSGAGVRTSINSVVTSAAGPWNDLTFNTTGTDGSNVERMRILNNGNVGIGTTDPLEKLHVVGNIRNSALAGTGNRAVYSDASGNFTNTSSDIRLKTNIENLSDRLDILGTLGRLRGIYYNWDTSNRAVQGLGTQKEIGMAAQEVQAVLPELVGENASGYLSLDYPKMTAYLVEVAKAQQKEIESLKLVLSPAGAISNASSTLELA